MNDLTLPYSKIDYTEPKYREARQAVIAAGVRDQYTVAEEKTHCTIHNCDTVYAMIGLHVCPICAAEQLGHRRQRLNIDQVIQDTIRREEERKQANAK